MTKQENQFNIFDYLDVKTLAEDLGLDVDKVKDGMINEVEK